MKAKSQLILVTGGAGYIGSVLVRRLLDLGYRVRVLDRLMYGGEPIVDLLNNDRFEFIKGDVRDRATCAKAVAGVDAVAHLAAIVGDPACAKHPEEASSTNLDGGKLLYEAAAAAGVGRFVFASTCSNYGRMSDPNAFVHEDSPLSPVSLYAKTKVEFEQYLLASKTKCAPVCLRFSTVYGLSPRLRFDLTVNEFTKEAAMGRELVIFGEQFWRPYCHVVDLARSVIACIEAPLAKIDHKVFNVGDTSENYQKQMLVEEIRKFIPELSVKYVSKVEDPRDYRVSFDKIRNELDFVISKKVPEGIQQTITAIRSGFISNPDAAQYKNI